MNFNFLSTWWWAYLAAVANIISSIIYSRQDKMFPAIAFGVAGIIFFCSGTLKGMLTLTLKTTGNAQLVENNQVANANLPLPVPPVGGSGVIQGKIFIGTESVESIDNRMTYEIAENIFNDEDNS